VSALILAGLALVGALVLYVRLVPRNTFIIVRRSGGGTISFSRSGVSFGPRPALIEKDGVDHLGPYVERLLAPSRRFKSLSIFTPDGSRGFALTAREGLVEAGLILDRREEVEREAAVRSFFQALHVDASRDYVAANGGVPEATRILEYPLHGNAPEITAMARRILLELCAVSTEEGLSVTYRER
jgi:hypothetical protein